MTDDLPLTGNLTQPIETSSTGVAWDVFLLLVLGTLIFLPRINLLPVSGEEHRRIVCAYEIYLSGNGFVPTVHGEPFLTRPPLQNWVILLTALVLGDFNYLSGRLPSFFCTLITILFVYGYARQLMSRSLGFLSAFFFMVNAYTIRFAASAETEPMFVLFLSASFLIWHWGDRRGWSETGKWTAAYILLAAATLTKGFNQAPLYFGLIIGLQLLLQCRLSNLLGRGHLIGLALFIALVGTWQIGYAYYAGWETTMKMHLGDVLLRFEGRSFETGQNGPLDYLEHAVVFPFELFAILLPGSLLLPAYLFPGFRRTLNSYGPIVAFSWGAVAVTLFSVWIPVGAKARYYMPMIPCFSILSAVVVQRCLETLAARRAALTSENRTGETEGIPIPTWAAMWPIFLRASVAGIILTGLISCFLAFTGFGKETFPVRTVPSVILFVSSLPLVVVLFRAREGDSIPKTRRAVIALMLFAALVNNLLYLDVNSLVCNRPGPEIRESLRSLPPNTEIRCLGDPWLTFIYYYTHETGKILYLVQPENLEPGDYFCCYEDTLQRLDGREFEIIERFASGRIAPKYASREPRIFVIGRLSDSRP